MFPRELLDCRLAVAEQDHQLRGAKIFERKCCLLVSCQHTQEKKRERRVLFPLKRANIAAFCLYDRAAGHRGVGHSTHQASAGHWLRVRAAGCYYLLSDVCY
jgi:hypothetical protein